VNFIELLAKVLGKIRGHESLHTPGWRLGFFNSKSNGPFPGPHGIDLF